MMTEETCYRTWHKYQEMNTRKF